MDCGQVIVQGYINVHGQSGLPVTKHLHLMRAEMEFSISIKRQSGLKKIREAANLMKNMIVNFLNYCLLSKRKI